MNNVLNIIPTGMAKATGFFKSNSNCSQNTNYDMYLPSKECMLYMSLSQIERIFETAIAKSVSYDYVTIHSGDFSNSSLIVLSERLKDLPLSSGARINCPATLIFGGIEE